MRAADANPGQAERYYAWVPGIAADTLAMDFRFGFDDAGFSGGFVASDGRQVALTEGLRLPA